MNKVDTWKDRMYIGVVLCHGCICKEYIKQHYHSQHKQSRYIDVTGDVLGKPNQSNMSSDLSDCLLQNMVGKLLKYIFCSFNVAIFWILILARVFMQ